LQDGLRVTREKAARPVRELNQPVDAGDRLEGASRLEPEALVEAFERMVLIREFEQEIHRLFLKGEVHGTTHLSAGQEAVPVGVCLALEPSDFVAGTYRGHGHALAKGTDPEPLAAEMLGRATGVCGGRAGSMNVVDLEHGLVGCFGIVGGSIAAATGAAVTAKRSGRVAVAFFGDGAVNQGYFHECLNFAEVLGLPALFVCESNFYGEFTPMEQVTAGRDIAARGAAFGVPSLVVDGNDVLAVHAAAQDAVARARAGDGPSLLECETYRHYGHSKSDPATYRPQEEVERWLERDPLVIARMRLTELGVSDEDLDAAATRAKERMQRASEAALDAPYPDPDTHQASEFAGCAAPRTASSSGRRSGTRSPRRWSATSR
jgi:TPP-dependent pyruvate/acetoin dehydrogenase alpha subunit